MKRVGRWYECDGLSLKWTRRRGSPNPTRSSESKKSNTQHSMYRRATLRSGHRPHEPRDGRFPLLIRSVALQVAEGTLSRPTSGG